MAKKRKTREQKIAANLRHNFSHTFTSEVPLSVKIQPQVTSSILKMGSPKTIVANAYPYLIKDLSKTAILTLAIFLAQIILFNLLRNHVILIPGISY
jgi:hypothetical protein